MKTAKTRILVIAYGLADRQTSYSHRIKDLVRAIDGDGRQVILLWFSPFYRCFRTRQFDGLRRHVHVVVFPTLPLGSMRGMARVGRLVIKTVLWFCTLIWPPRLVHAETSLSAALAISCLRRSLLTVDFHGDQPAELRMANAPAWRITQAESDVATAICHADAIVCVSKNLRQRLLGGTSTREIESCIVPCGVDLDRFHAAQKTRQLLRQEFGVTNRVVLCYAGGTQVWQCIAETLELVRKLKEATPELFFLFVTPEAPNRWQRELHAIGVEGIDHREISSPPELVPRYLGAADVGLLLRRQDQVNTVASPTKCAEYLAAGMPVVTTRHAGDSSLIINETGCGEVLDDVVPTPAELVRLRNFLEMVPSRRVELAEKCMATASEYHDWRVGAARLKAMVDRLLSTPR